MSAGPSFKHAWVVEFPGGSKPRTVVARTEKDHINAFHRTNLLQILHCFRVFYLHNHKPLLVRLSDIIRNRNVAVSTIGAAPIQSSSTQRRKTSHSDNVQTVLQVQQVRYHDSSGIDLQRFNPAFTI